MTTQLSPGVVTNEIDLTTIVPSVSTSTGAFAGVFRWGPVGERVLIDSETTLVSRFGVPTNYNPETFFTCANFLGYGNQLIVSRAANTSGATPVQTFTCQSGNNVLVGNTTGVLPGQYIAQVSNSTVMTNIVNNSVVSVNSTAITLLKPAAAGGNTQISFGNPETSYSALGLEGGTFIANLINQTVTNEEYYTNVKKNNFQSGVTWVARCVGDKGNTLRVAQCDNPISYNQTIPLANSTVSGLANVAIGSNTVTISFVGDGSLGSAGVFASTVSNELTIGDQVQFGNSAIGVQFMQISSVSNVTTNTSASALTINFSQPYRLHTNFTSNTLVRYWEFFNAVGRAPGQSQFQLYNGNTAALDDLHVDDGGDFTGIPGTILETYVGLSRATDAQNNDGTNNYYADVINQDSEYIFWGADRPSAISNNSVYLTSSTSTAPGDYNFTLGFDGHSEGLVTLATVAQAINMFASKEDVQIDLVMQGKPIQGTTVVNGQTVQNFQYANYLIQNIAGERKDCVVFISPDPALVINNKGNEAYSIVNWVGALQSSSYAVIDSGYKYQYDRYNNLYRWIPLNGDIAGLCARTDQTNDAWWSPAGYNRGAINNVVKLPWNPRQTERDVIYQGGINPVMTVPGQGTVLFGDKTFQAKPSAFDRINVRRLFLVLERAISTAAKYSLFEFNDTFTRAQFVNLVTPYLRTIQGRRGITDFLVVCDATNNTPQIIDSNQFVGDIYIKPARSINFITLNFVAVATGVQFSTVVGKFG